MHGEFNKTLKFIIKVKKEQIPILERMTARHTFGVTKYLEVLSQFGLDSLPKPGELDILTITTKDRLEASFDLKKETGLNTCFSQQCGRKALQMMKSFQTSFRTWEWRRDSASSSTIMRILSEIEMSPEGEVIKSSTAVEEAIGIFSKTRLWRRIRKNRPSLPLRSQKNRPKKIPIHFQYESNFLGWGSKKERIYYKFEGERLLVKLSTIKLKQPIILELEYGDYHVWELEQGRMTGGKIIKNLAKNRWEFHASIRKTIPERDLIQKQKKAVIGVDLGISVDATVVVLLENEKLRQERFHFLKEPELRKKKFNIERARKKFQRIADTTNGNERKQAVQELKNICNNYEQVSNEACHRIAKRVAAIARKYLEEGYEVQVAIGQLRGLKHCIRKGDGKGKKFRGKISKFPYSKLTKYIRYKCREVGVSEENIAEVKESWTSRMCHKCRSINTKRPTQASFECLDCGCKYNADANGAINIALRYWMKNACSKCRSLKNTYKKSDVIVCLTCGQKHSIKENTKANSEIVRMIFLSSSNKRKKSEGLSKSARPLLKVMKNVEKSSLYDAPLGTGDSPPCDESAGDEGLAITNPDQLKVEEAGKRKHFLEVSLEIFKK